MDRDRQHLKLLEIFHYIRGALACLLGFLGLAYGLIFLLVALGSVQSSGTNHIPIPVAIIVTSLGFFFFVFGEICGVLSIFAGWKYRRLKSYYFCFVFAVLECLTGATGIALGVFAIVVLNRPSVKALFAGKASPPQPAKPPDSPRDGPPLPPSS